jgi:hypothetical protein
VEICGKVATVEEVIEALSVCSGCAGDYEDPERTAGEEMEELLEGFEDWPVGDSWFAADRDADWLM